MTCDAPRVQHRVDGRRGLTAAVSRKTLADTTNQRKPAAQDSKRLGALGFEDGLRFRPSNRRLSASVRDFARIASILAEQGQLLGVVMTSARGNWGQPAAGDLDSPMNRHLGRLADAFH